MRPLTEEETKTMFEKLTKYIGENIKLLIKKVLAERIEQNLEGMSKQLSKEVLGLKDVQKLQQVNMMTF